MQDYNIQDYYINDVDMVDEAEHNANYTPTIDHHVTIVNNKYVIDPSKKYIRTTLKLDDGTNGGTNGGTYVTARINTETGEVKPYTYAKKSKSKLVITKPKQSVIDRITDYDAEGDLLGYEPSWVHVSKIERDIAQTKANGVKPPLRKSMANPHRTILDEFSTMQDACDEYPWLEDILFGVTHLDCGGNTRPFSMKKFFYMLRDLDEINVETIYAYTTYSKSHCYKVAKHMRVVVAAFNREVTRKGHDLKLILTAVENKTTKNNLPFLELTFKYPNKEKIVKYCVWSFIHTKENGLESVWNKALTAKVGCIYDIHYQKLVFQEQLHFVITCLDIVNS